MTKTEIKKALIESIKKGENGKQKRWVCDPGTITKTQLACFVQQKNLNRVKEKYLKDLECFEGKYYLIDDVAQNLFKKWN